MSLYLRHVDKSIWWWMAVGVCVTVAIFLRIDRLAETMPFIGDQAWFYLSARDMLLGHGVPVVGIEASRTWLHQGPYWTYLLAVLLWFGHFNPLFPGYVMAVLGSLSIIPIFVMVSEMFGKRLGIIVAWLCAISPLLIFSDRMPYHTSIIPFLSFVLMYVLYKIKERTHTHVLILIGLALLVYSINLASAVLWVPIVLYIVWNSQTRVKFIESISKPRYLLSGLGISFLVLLPFLIHDAQHNFEQTVKFASLFIYIPFQLLTHKAPSHTSYSQMTNFFSDAIRMLLYSPSAILSGVVAALGLGVVARRASYSDAYKILLLFAVVPVIAIYFNKTPSQAYLHSLYLSIVCCAAAGIELAIDRLKAPVVFALLVAMGIGNVYDLQVHDYYVGPAVRSGALFTERMEVAHKIVKEADGKPFTLKAVGPGSEFKSTTMNTEYLTWWLGNGPTPAGSLIYMLEERDGHIKLIQ